MHRCLGILEIVESICANLDPASYRPSLSGNSGALAALARTSTMMSGPALNMLWRTLNDPTPFLKLLPRDLFTVAPDGLSGIEIWRMVRPIMPADLERPLVYAVRVKAVFITWYTAKKFSDIFLSLSMCCPGGLLFPTLHTFSWDQMMDRTGTFCPLRMFCPSTLTRISLFDSGFPTTLSLLSALAIDCPGLKHLCLDFVSPTHHVQIAVSTLVCGLKDIHTLKLGVPTSAALLHIAQLSGLTSLELTGLPALLEGAIQPIFPRLLHLILGPIDIQPATEFLSSLVDSPLHSLQVILKTCVTVAETDAFFRTLRATLSPKSLKSFTLRNNADLFPTEEQENNKINAHSLGILSCFSGLTALSIMSPVGFDLDDAAVDRLATAWPRLHELTLQTNIMAPPIHLTLNALRSLAAHCPQLNSLDIEFDPTPVPPAREGDRVVQESLESLSVGCSPIVRPGPVARYLSSLFPNLRSISTAREDEDNEDPEEVEHNGQAISYHRRWKQVEEHVPEIHTPSTVRPTPEGNEFFYAVVEGFIMRERASFLIMHASKYLERERKTKVKDIHPGWISFASRMFRFLTVMYVPQTG
ncbi:hypothetical protein DFH06DRAFT_1308588, partial [Mycena polygramma]